MAGWTLKEGDITSEIVYDDEFWSLFDYVLSSACRKTNTYKFAFIKAICNQIYEARDDGNRFFLSYDNIFLNFTETYWKLVNVYKFNQMLYNGKSMYSKVELILLAAANKYGISKDKEFNSISKIVQSEIVNNVKEECIRCVVGALYSDFEGKLYSFRLSSGGIYFSKKSYQFLSNHSTKIDQLTNEAWIEFMKKINDNVVVDPNCLSGNKKEMYRRNVEVPGNKGDIEEPSVIYNKYGDIATIESIKNDRISILLQRTQVFNEGGIYIRKPGQIERLEISERDLGIDYFYEVEDIGDMESLTNPSGAYTKNISAIQKHYEEELKNYEDDLPLGERIDERKKQRIIDSYFDLEGEKRKESRFIEKNSDCFGRIDLDTRYGVGHGIKYFQSRHHDICYVSKGKYRQLPGGIHVVNWRSDIADFYYNQEKTFYTSLNYVDIFNDSLGTGVTGIEYDYTLMLKRSYTANPFAFKNLYIGGEHSTNDEGANLYENGSIDPFLVQIIEEKRLENKLTDIIVSIQANQNEMIRHTHTKNMLVQGCAGSGKTMILLHRISYLKYNKYLTDFSKAVIIVPNKNFNMFIDELAENLEIEKMPRMTMRQYYLKLARDYQSILDKDFNGAAATIESIFDNLEKREFMSTNATSSDEDFTDEYEYTLCDFYDNSITKYYEKVKLDEILKIAERFGIKFNKEQPTYKQFNDLYTIVHKEISSTYDAMENEEERKLVLVEKEWKRFDELVLGVKELLDALTALEQAVGINITMKQLRTRIKERELLSISITEKEASVARLKKESENAPRGFLRLLSDASSVTKDTLEVEIKELEALKEKFKNIEVPTFAGDDSVAQQVENQLNDMQVVVEQRQNVGTSFYKSSLNQLRELLEQLNSGAISLKKGVEILTNLCKELDDSIEVQRIKKEYNETKIKLEQVRKLMPNEDEKKLLTGAENILKNRRRFVLDIFKEFSKITADKIEKGRQVFSLLALYCLHIGRAENDIKYIFVDEGQDYSESEYRILRAIHKDGCRFEVYGDVAQCITSNRGLKNWSYLKSLLDADYYEMKENYRNTVEIAEYVNKNVMNVFRTIGFHGPEVKVIKALWNVKIIDGISKGTGKRIGVICHDKGQIEQLGSKVISYLKKKDCLYSVIDAKGLEFDIVYVIPQNMSINERYVAYSRALNELTVLV